MLAAHDQDGGFEIKCLRIVPLDTFTRYPVGMDRSLEDRRTLGMGTPMWQGIYRPPRKKKELCYGGVGAMEAYI